MLCRAPAFFLLALLGLGCTTSDGDGGAPTCPAKETVRSRAACTQEGLGCASVERSYPDECHIPAGPGNPETGCDCRDGKWQCVKFGIVCTGEAGTPVCPARSSVQSGAPCAGALTCPADAHAYPDACNVPIANNPTVDCTCALDGSWQCPTIACPLDDDAGRSRRARDRAGPA